MKQKTYIAALLAGMLALAGCGGGSSSTNQPDPPREKTPLEIAQEKIKELEGNDNRSEADKLAENTRICEAGGGKYANGACTPDTTKADNDARIATAKELKAAIGIVGVNPAVTTVSIPAFDLDGAGDSMSVTINLKKGTGTVAALGGWAGADYEGMEGTGAAKHTGMVRSYSNAEAAKKVAFVGSAGEAIHGLTDSNTSNNKDDYTVPLRVNTADENIAGSAFPTTGTETYEGNDRKFAGTYMGASGTYECTGNDNACRASARGDDGILLTGAWTFTPSAGAMLDMTDDRYLQFGWWVRKDNDGDPTHAGAFYRSTTSLTPFTEVNNNALVGKATYMGKAAGKFAVSDGLRPADDHSGHFTADARLEADFKSAGSTLSGTINSFRLNDGTTDPGWSVELQKAGWDSSNNRFQTAGTTVWSIGTAKGGAAGTWEAQLYDDKADAGSNNTPQSVAGKFHSVISTTHEMVGAFGAELQSN